MQLEDIKKLRKRFNLTQGDLAKKAGVSQSLIAKIESDRIDPTYKKARLILDALELLDKKEGTKIKDLMTKNIRFLRPNDKLKDAIKKMKSHNISQLPVTDRCGVLGLVTESTILDSISKIEDPSKLVKLTVKDIMGEAPPAISIETPQRIAYSLLKHFPVLIVTRKGKIAGLITKSDLLKII